MSDTITISDIHDIINGANLEKEYKEQLIKQVESGEKFPVIVVTKDRSFEKECLEKLSVFEQRLYTANVWVKGYPKGESNFSLEPTINIFKILADNTILFQIGGYLPNVEPIKKEQNDDGIKFIIYMFKYNL